MHSYYGGAGGLQLPLMRVRATRQHGDRRGRLARSGFGLQEDPTRFKTENRLSARSKIAKLSGIAAAVGTREPSNLSVRISPHWQLKGDCNEVGVKNVPLMYHT